MIIPYLPSLLTDFFSSKIYGSDIRCEDFEPTGLPDACIQGSAENVFWASITAFITNSVLVFLFAPMTGVWSDILGRKPFLIISLCLSVVSKAIVLFHVFFGTTLYAYYPTEVINGVVSPSVVTLAAVADVTPPRHRAAMFSITLGAFSGGFGIMPKLGVALGLKGAIAVCVALKVLAILYTIVRFPRDSMLTLLAPLPVSRCSPPYRYICLISVLSRSCSGSVAPVCHVKVMLCANIEFHAAPRIPSARIPPMHAL